MEAYDVVLKECLKRNIAFVACPYPAKNSSDIASVVDTGAQVLAVDIDLMLLHDLASGIMETCKDMKVVKRKDL